MSLKISIFASAKIINVSPKMQLEMTYTDMNGRQQPTSTAGMIRNLERAINLIRTARAVYRQNGRYSDTDTDKEYMLRGAAMTLEGAAASLRSMAAALDGAAANMHGQADATRERRQAAARGDGQPAASGAIGAQRSEPGQGMASQPSGAKRSEAGRTTASEASGAQRSEPGQPTASGTERSEVKRYTLRWKSPDENHWHYEGSYDTIRDALQAARWRRQACGDTIETLVEDGGAEHHGGHATSAQEARRAWRGRLE